MVKNMKQISDVLKIFRMITSFSYVVQHGNMACVSGIVGVDCE